MVFHPHFHFIVPAGAVSDDGSKWRETPENFLFPEAVASKIYRQKFREALRDAGLEDDARQREVAGLAVSRLDLLAGKRHCTST